MSINVDNSAIKRLEELRAEKNLDALMLRVRVEGGGCSGFQYMLDLTDEKKESDLVFSDAVITDDISLPFLEGSTIKFEDALIGSDFKIENPNAVAGCGCGTSFSV
ncbi:MAG: HesB/IscA family protein [Alphaproteobacteria bacterium]